MINVKALLNLYTQFKQNPSQFLSQINVPNEYMNDPQGAIQYLMNSGKITQEQYNFANNQFKELQNNPLFKQMFNK
jgi:hypothetical protein